MLSIATKVWYFIHFDFHVLALGFNVLYHLGYNWNNTLIREHPFNLKGGGAMVFWGKKHFVRKMDGKFFCLWHGQKRNILKALLYASNHDSVGNVDNNYDVINGVSVAQVLIVSDAWREIIIMSATQKYQVLSLICYELRQYRRFINLAG